MQIDRERVALDILNSDREMRGLAPVRNRMKIQDSDCYLINADAAIAAIVDLRDAGKGEG